MLVIKGYKAARQALLECRKVSGDKSQEDAVCEQAVREIIEAVRCDGDAALIEYAKCYDNVELLEIEVDIEDAHKAKQSIDVELLKALEMAVERIRSYHEEQKKGLEKAVEAMEGRQELRAIAKTGVYVPGGTAVYPSTVLMTAIPAKVAGVKELAMITPPDKNGEVPMVTLAAASIAGVDRIFLSGGAQAIAALALGTQTIPKVDKICGPGNIYVTTAKKLLYGTVGIDGLYGPSEVVIVADETAKAVSVAADMMAQAEHDRLAQTVFITTSEELAVGVATELNTQLEELDREEIIKHSLDNNGIIIIVKGLEEALELANVYAPEHLLLLVDNAEERIGQIENAGCIIYGEKATVAVSDYIDGPSHALPTGGTARFSSPLGVADFMKYIDIVNVDKKKMGEVGEAAQKIAQAEGLTAHAKALEKRREEK